MTDILDHVMKCPLCNGTGETEQTYTAGCGMGSYRSKGPCQICATEPGYWEGVGWVYRGSRKPVPASVLNQINVALGAS